MTPEVQFCMELIAGSLSMIHAPPLDDSHLKAAAENFLMGLDVSGWTITKKVNLPDDTMQLINSVAAYEARYKPRTTL